MTDETHPSQHGEAGEVDGSAGSPPRARWSRAALLRVGIVLPASILLAIGVGRAVGHVAGAPARQDSPPDSAADPATLAPTPACSDDDDDLTPAQTEGPYFKRSSLERASLLEPGMPGTRLVLTGHVLATDCRPVARALLDFWQADAGGQYDNTGFRLRGHQFTDDSGAYRLETVVPGLYPGRTRHIHVKVQAPNRPVLTSQLYFPGEPRNASDGIYDARLLMDVQDAGDGRDATFDFVLDLA
jgi:protocatechuate 3,4-dioxygenase beta subunit